MPHGFTCPQESPRRPWSSSGTASAPHARCAWTPSPSVSHRPVSPRLAFTYRHFGDSGGQPRQLLSIKRQLADWDAAIAWVKNRRDVDGTRIAVWGSSFGGGHSITVASRHPELKAAVAQCPFTDGLASALALGPTESLKVLPSVARDFASMVFRRPPAMIPLAGPPGSLALMNAPDALPGYEALLPPDTTFRNEVAARVAPTIATYRPGRAAKKIKFPILFCVSNTDSVTPPAQTLRYARTAPRGEIKRYDAGHFDFYLGEPFEALVRDQVEFLTRQLQPAGHKAPLRAAHTERNIAYDFPARPAAHCPVARCCPIGS